MRLDGSAWPCGAAAGDDGLSHGPGCGEHDGLAQGPGALTAPLAVVQVKEVEAGSAGFQNYLGQRYDAETRSWTEAFGQKVSVKFLVTLYSPRQDGERGCRALVDRVAEAFLRGGPEGFAVETWSVGETGFDRESGSFRGKIQAVCRGMLTAVTSESGALVGFRVKGEVRTWNE